MIPNNFIGIGLMLILSHVSSHAGEIQAQVRLGEISEGKTFDRHRLLGTNLALWHDPAQLENPNIQNAMKDLAPAFIRIPGGSWSDEYFWNGNGVRDGNTFTSDKNVNGKWQVDYSGYAPGFRLAATDGSLSDFHGHVDVKVLHDIVKSEGAHAVVTVNAGSGTPEMAAEWVKWANQVEEYGVIYWEVGNELEGAWEMGHILPDGSKMTGEIYANRFLHFARAMKAVDPDIKVGGPTASNLDAVFLEDTLRIAGDALDFISVHTYPVGSGQGEPEAFFEALTQLSSAMQRYRQLIKAYQPEREHEIEIAITEWNSKVFEDRDTGDLLNGLWTAAFVGEMFRHGVSFANQWDLLTRTEEGGHGLFAEQEEWVPTGQYWAMWLWSKHMGDTWIDATVESESMLQTYVTRSDDRLQMMVVNPSRSDRAKIKLDAGDLTLNPNGRQITLSHATYLWDPFHHAPVRSTSPRPAPVFPDNTGRLDVPPYSVRVFEFSLAGQPAPVVPESVKPEKKLAWMVPDESAADLPLEVWLVLDGPTQNGDLPISISGPVASPPGSIEISENAGRLLLAPTGPGTVTVRAFEATASITVRAVESREAVIWDFEKPLTEWGIQSAFPLKADQLIRPNQQVAAIHLADVLPDKGKDHLLVIDSLDESLPKTRINGVRLDVRVEDLKMLDQKTTNLQVVLQSHADHWMVLGQVPLSDLQDGWTTLRFPLRGPEDVRAVGASYALRLQLIQKSRIKTPVSSTIYIDNLGFIYR